MCLQNENASMTNRYTIISLNNNKKTSDTIFTDSGSWIELESNTIPHFLAMKERVK